MNDKTPEKRIEYRNHRISVGSVLPRMRTAEEVRVLVSELNDLIEEHAGWKARISFVVESDAIEVCAGCGNPYQLIETDDDPEWIGLCAWGGADCSPKVPA